MTSPRRRRTRLLAAVLPAPVVLPLAGFAGTAAGSSSGMRRTHDRGQFEDAWPKRSASTGKPNW